MNKNWIQRGLISGCALLALAGVNLAQQNAAAPDVEVLHVRGNIYILAGAGANITLSVGPDGVFMVDSGRAEMTDKVLAAVNRISQQQVRFGQPATRNEGGGGSGTVLTGYAKPKPIRYIANTSMLPDHAGGNEKLSAAGVTFTGGNVAGDLATAGEGAAIVAHENVLQRLSDTAKGPLSRPCPRKRTSVSR